MPSEQERLLRRFDNWLHTRGLSRATVKVYVRIARGLCRWVTEEYGANTVKTLSPDELGEYFEVQVQAMPGHMARSSQMAAALRSFGAWLVDIGLVEVNPGSGIKYDRAKDMVARAERVEEDQVERFISRLLELDTSVSRRLATVLCLYRELPGIGISALLALPTAAYIPDAGTVEYRVRRDEVRVVTLSARTETLLREHLRTNLPPSPHRDGVRPRRLHTSTLIRTADGHPYTRQGVWKLLRRNANLLGANPRLTWLRLGAPMLRERVATEAAA